MSKAKKIVLLTLMLGIMMTSLLGNISFANATEGILAPVQATHVYYTNNQIHTIYTDSKYLSFLSADPSVDSYNVWITGNQVAPTMGEYFQERMHFSFQSEGTYELNIITYSPINGWKQQAVTVVYNENIDTDIITVTEADISDFTYVNDEAIATFSARVQDLSWQGISESDFRIEFINPEIMKLSRGRAVTYKPNIQITRVSSNSNEYIVSGTVNAGFYHNRSGEYYLKFQTLERFRFVNWSDMFPKLYLD
ncbi:hypothetical protein RBH29_07345 [Herbivorax sp. ANBcel31]|uniref:hypothetical protein n=1 Tax=Herbivorax sp. ANBcel31 TaxID=3069754 RepID=UPI0027AEDA50|nr:hypothetical protein [Herbivorax sp. ANBcel31]MDQ2086243.1 hypothetical protein [Herbivorax sp. ANBcel31]